MSGPTPGLQALCLWDVTDLPDRCRSARRSPGQTGLHCLILATASRLSNAVIRLTREHAAIAGLVADLLTRVSDPPIGDDVEAIRDLGTALLGHLAQHRQRGADLVYEAYHADIRGEM